MVGATLERPAGGATAPPAPRSADEVLRLIQRDDSAAANALLALVRSGVRRQPGDRILLSFAAQVIDRKSAGRRDLLSARQLELWRERAARYAADLAEIAARKVGPIAPPAPAPERFDVGAIVALFDRAKQHLDHPKIRLQAADGSPVALSIAGERARHPGSVNVTDGHPFQEGTFYGRVHTDGRFERGRGCTDAVAELLAEFAADPAGVAAEYGRLTGNCCFCRRHLSDERSTAVGYGPICAERWGLPWGEAESAE